jgi:PAS domain-containing protein
MIAPRSVPVPDLPSRLHASEDVWFDHPWCRAAQTAGLAAWRYDVVADRLMWSEALHAALGYPALPSTPTIRWWMSRVHPDDVASVARAYDAASAHALDGWAVPYRLRRSDGSYSAVTDFGTAVRDDSGELVGLMGYLSFR